jgi:hypothetical protein
MWKELCNYLERGDFHNLLADISNSLHRLDGLRPFKLEPKILFNSDQHGD